jgi:hypothetical protein
MRTGAAKNLHAVSRKLHSPAQKARRDGKWCATEKNPEGNFYLRRVRARVRNKKLRAIKIFLAAQSKKLLGSEMLPPFTAHVFIAVARLACAGLGAHGAGGKTW